MYTITILSANLSNVIIMITDGVTTYREFVGPVPADTPNLQAYLDDNAGVYWMDCVDNNRTPLTPEQIADIQDQLKTQDFIDAMSTDIALITTAAPDPNTGSGYKAAFAAAAFNALTANQQTTLIRNTISAMLTMQLDLMRSVRMLLKWKKNTSAVGAAQAQAAGK